MADTVARLMFGSEASPCQDKAGAYTRSWAWHDTVSRYSPDRLHLVATFLTRTSVELVSSSWTTVDSSQ